MSTMKWVKPGLIILLLIFAVWLAPSQPIDPWKLLSLKKVASMLLALAAIQTIGIAMTRLLGIRSGAILTGFLGGIISSTATTASLARNSKNLSNDQNAVALLTFLAATGAMLVEGIVFVVIGSAEFKIPIILIFMGPFLAIGLLLVFRSKKLKISNLLIQNSEFKLLPLIKLTLFIVGILAFSKILQAKFGQYGLLVFTFLVSLFEVHGSIIANVQLQNNNGVDILLLGHLLSISIAASFVSKFFLVLTLGSRYLIIRTLRFTAILLLSLAASWGAFVVLQ